MTDEVKKLIKEEKANEKEMSKPSQTEELLPPVLPNTQEVPLLPPPAQATENTPTVQTTPKQSGAMQLVERQSTELLKTNGIKEQGAQIAREGINADFAGQTADIHAKNIEAAEKQLENETHELRLMQRQAELTLDHKYQMSIIGANGRHKAMLNRREKMEQKYGYLYEHEEVTDDMGKVSIKLIDFSYSEVVNRIRTFTRNISKLDTAAKKLIKWAIIMAGIIALVAILKHYGIIN